MKVWKDKLEAHFKWKKEKHFNKLLVFTLYDYLKCKIGKMIINKI